MFRGSVGPDGWPRKFLVEIDVIWVCHGHGNFRNTYNVFYCFPLREGWPFAKRGEVAK